MELIKNNTHEKEIATKIAKTLYHLDMNLNLAPVVDFDNPNYPMIGWKFGRNIYSIS